MYIMLGPRTSRIMVAQAEASQEAPVSLVSGNANSAWATTIGLASYGGSGTPH
ncbi:ash family protein [Serratia proteamaculans]|uniref:ash family protein n=1 Tax=Serratia proteamaculans TaxID=28151 RepID=UPI0021BB421C|nr:ash family protein [Serratia proteamaculans]